MFESHILLVNAFAKVRRFINRIIIGQEYSGKHSTKDISFNIQSLVDQLYQLSQITPDRPELSKINFLKNSILDLLDESINQLSLSIQAFNQSLYRVWIFDNTKKHKEIGQKASSNHSIELDVGTNDELNKFYLSTRKSLILTSNLTNLNIQSFSQSSG